MSMMLRWGYRLLMNMTPAEIALEPVVASLGERYRCQYPFLKHKLFADFALLDRKLVLEVDGTSHDKPAQKKKDAEHAIALHLDGWSTVRVTNEQALAGLSEKALTALLEKPQTLAELQSKLADLKVAHPELWIPKPKKASRKRVAGRRKRKKPARRRA